MSPKPMAIARESFNPKPSALSHHPMVYLQQMQLQHVPRARVVAHIDLDCFYCQVTAVV